MPAPESSAAELGAADFLKVGTSKLLVQQFPSEAWGFRLLPETVCSSHPMDCSMGSHSHGWWPEAGLPQVLQGSTEIRVMGNTDQFITPSPRCQQIYVEHKWRQALTFTGMDVDLLKYVCVF